MKVTNMDAKTTWQVKLTVREGEDGQFVAISDYHITTEVPAADVGDDERRELDLILTEARYKMLAVLNRCAHGLVKLSLPAIVNKIRLDSPVSALNLSVGDRISHRFEGNGMPQFADRTITAIEQETLSVGSAYIVKKTATK